MTIDITLSIGVALSYVTLAGCIIFLCRELSISRRDLRGLITEYKMYQALKGEDYATAGVLRNSLAGGENKPAPLESELEKEEPNPKEATITQFG